VPDTPEPGSTTAATSTAQEAEGLWVHLERPLSLPLGWKLAPAGSISAGAEPGAGGVL